MKNLLEVIRFEVIRSFKKASFWITAIALPVMLGLYIAIAAFAGYSAGESMESGINIDDSKIAYLDEAGYIKTPDYTTSTGETHQLISMSSKEAGIAAVKSDKVDIFFYIPTNFAPSTENPEADSIEVYAQPDNISILDNYAQPIANFLSASAMQNIDPTDLMVINNAINYETTVYDKTDGHVVDISELISKLLPPGVALICFYILICVLGNRLVTAMVEEKENRISELLLTSIKPTHLIIGKTISLMILGITQLLIVVIPIVIFLIVASRYNALPLEFQLQVTPLDVTIALILLVISYFLFTTLSVLVGTLTSTAKDANSYSAIFVIMVIMPIMFMNIFLDVPSNLAFVQFLTFFPPSAPIALMLRCITSSITPIELMLGIAEIFVVGLLIMKLATHIFCKNALGFNPKINFKKLLNSPRETWK